MVQVKVHVDVLVLGTAHKVLPLARVSRRGKDDNLVLGHIRTNELVRVTIEVAQVVRRNAVRHGKEALAYAHLRRIQQLDAQQALGLTIAIGQALEHIERNVTAIGGRMPLSDDFRRRGRIVGIALTAGYSRQIEQYADVVLGGPLNSTVDIIDDRDVGSVGLLRAKGIPRHRQAHGVETDLRHTTKIVLAHKRLVMATHALVIGSGAHCLLQLRRVGCTGRRIQRRGHPGLGNKPAREINAENPLHHGPLRIAQVEPASYCIGKVSF